MDFKQPLWLDIHPPVSSECFIEIVVRDISPDQHDGVFAKQLVVEIGEIVHARNALARVADPLSSATARRDEPILHISAQVFFAMSDQCYPIPSWR